MCWVGWVAREFHQLHLKNPTPLGAVKATSWGSVGQQTKSTPQNTRKGEEEKEKETDATGTKGFEGRGGQGKGCNKGDGRNRHQKFFK